MWRALAACFVVPRAYTAAQPILRFPAQLPGTIAAFQTTGSRRMSAPVSRPVATPAQRSLDSAQQTLIAPRLQEATN
jgi:hypothetical protein